MISFLAKKFLGSRNERQLSKIHKKVAEINAAEADIQRFSNDELRAKTDEFRSRLEQGSSLDDLLVEAFAVVREAASRTLGMRHFDVQLIGGIVLHSGKIAEMRTGEGKTLMATLPAYLNALSGRGVHIVTVNDYLAKRDAEWMTPVYELLGIRVGVILTNLTPLERQQAYAADITYGTNNEFGFDYLRDNMAFSQQDKVQRELNFAIVDEVDSILIDEARTPLIISGPAEESSEHYQKITKLIPTLTLRVTEEGEGDYYLDEKSRQAYFTESGHERIDELLLSAKLIQPGESVYDAKNINLMHFVTASLRAHALFQRDVDYIVQDGEIIIIDEHTGRAMPGRRWSDGLHQAIEAKENVRIQNENQTLASITFQNYFRLFDKLAGMTGTADTEAFEFQEIYGLEVLVIPTNKPTVRKDFPDQVFLTAEEKFNAVIDDIKECQQRRQPVLVGTASIETSEFLAQMLKRTGIRFQVLNAKFHEKEAQIIAQAGRPGAVTIATNMAGRGTDIVLGGNLESELAALNTGDAAAVAAVKSAWAERQQEVLAAGGLHIIGSERHESRRIDNQLRGRSGRQGDPGSTRFYLSLEDNLMRIFASERIAGLMQKLGLKKGEAIEHPWVNRAIENAQKKVEGRNFDIRKQLLGYDDVANQQRKEIYSYRELLLKTEDASESIRAAFKDVVLAVCDEHIPPQSLDEQWDISGLTTRLANDFSAKLPLQAWLDADAGLHEEGLKERIVTELMTAYQAKEQHVSPEVLRQVEKSILLQSLDVHWKEHLAAMDHLRQGIHLRGYAQKNPVQEYKRESFTMFADMLDRFKHDVITTLSRIQVQTADTASAMNSQRRAAENPRLQFEHATSSALHPEGEHTTTPKTSVAAEHKPYIREEPKVGRNDPCPCGSRKKYKSCHGQL